MVNEICVSWVYFEIKIAWFIRKHHTYLVINTIIIFYYLGFPLILSAFKIIILILLFNHYFFLFLFLFYLLTLLFFLSFLLLLKDFLFLLGFFYFLLLAFPEFFVVERELIYLVLPVAAYKGLYNSKISI